MIKQIEQPFFMGTFEEHVCCWRSNCLELTARWPTWSGMFCRHFQTDA